MAPRSRANKAKGKSWGHSSKKEADAKDWSAVAGDLNKLATQNKLSSDVPGARIAAIVAAAAAFFLYANAIVVCQFPYDDGKAIRENPDVLNLRGDGTMSPFLQFWHNDFWGTPLDSPYTHKSYRPLVIQSFRLDASISGEPWIFHLTNGLLYATCAWLVVDILLQPALRAGVSAADGAKQNVLILSGLWFAAHPVHVESVAGIVGRAEIFSAILCMLGAKYGDAQELLSSAVCFAAACLCKETAVVIPAMIGAVELLANFIAPKKEVAKTSGGQTREKKQVERAVVYFSTSFGYLLFRSWLFASSRGSTSTLRGSVMLEDSFMQHVHPSDKFRTALFIMAKYTQLMFWPGALSCDYGLGVIDPVTSWTSFEMGVVVLAAVSVFAWVFYGLFQLHKTGDQSPLLAVGWAFAPLVPASHIVDIGTVMAERLAFTPTIGVAMLICHLGGICAASNPTIWRNVQISLFAVCLWFGIRTLNRVPDWQESKTLFLADVKSYPRGVKLLDSAAKQLVVDDPALGFEYAKRAQEITDEYNGIFKEERYITGLLQMANLKVRIDKWSEGANLTEAIEYSDEIIRHGEVVKPLDEDTSRIVYTIKGTAFFRLGRSSLDQGLLSTAIKNFQIAEGLDNSSRGDRVLYCEYATCLAQAGKKEEAYEKFHKCYSREPEEDLLAGDLGNYAILMKELSGVDIKDDREAAIAAAKKWGDRAIEGIEKYMSHANFPQSHTKAWVKVVGDVKLLQSGINIPAEDS